MHVYFVSFTSIVELFFLIKHHFVPPSVKFLLVGLGVMVLNATFNNILFILWWSVLLVEVNLSCRRSLTNFITQLCTKYTSPWIGFELPILVVMGTDCTSSCKSNYHTITTTTALNYFLNKCSRKGYYQSLWQNVTFLLQLSAVLLEIIILVANQQKLVPSYWLCTWNT